MYWTKFAKKECFPSRKRTVNTAIKFYILELVLGRNSRLNWHNWVFGPNLPKKSVSGLKQKKWKPPLNFAYSNYELVQVPNFSPNWQFWCFGLNLPTKGKKQKKQKKRTKKWIFFILKILISLGIKLNLNWQFWSFRPNLPKNDVCHLKLKKWILPLNFAYSN